jgi:hypothetical protein
VARLGRFELAVASRQCTGRWQEAADERRVAGVRMRSSGRDGAASPSPRQTAGRAISPCQTRAQGIAQTAYTRDTLKGSQGKSQRTRPAAVCSSRFSSRKGSANQSARPIASLIPQVPSPINRSICRACAICGRDGLNTCRREDEAKRAALPCTCPYQTTSPGSSRLSGHRKKLISELRKGG